MNELFAAAKAGRVEELKKLKKAGVSLNKKDKEGNTALLWAACCGHLETVQWLSSTLGNAALSKKNNTGNTALHLAAAYGHLEIVRYLLSNKAFGLSLSDTNKVNYTALMQAVLHGQLSVVDYLIRHYYTAGFNKKEQHQIALLANNKAITYYLNVCTTLSQNKIDFTEFTSLLERAARALQEDELSFIYLLFFWKQVYSKANTVPCSVECHSSTPLMQKLSVGHQKELILFMFQQECILTHYSIDKGQLNTTGIILDNQLIKQIERTLQQSKQDASMAYIQILKPNYPLQPLVL